MNYPARIAALAQRLNTEGVDAFFAHSPYSMGYLTGHHEDPGKRFTAIAVRADGEIRAICPALSEVQLQKAGIPRIATWRDGEDPVALFRTLADDWDLRSGVLAVDTTLPAHMLLKMQDALPAALFKDGAKLLGGLMAQKGTDELDLLRRAGKMADDAFDEVQPLIKPGLTEEQVAQMLLDAMKRRGGEPYFAIIGAGPNGAEPHHLNDSTVLKTGDVVILDFGCNLEGYKSDITRTVCLGKASDEAKHVYDVVFRAHQAARAAIVPGATGEIVDQGARGVIEAAGYGEQFFHRTGHGIGMNGHEDPYIVKGNDVPLEPGNTFSIEPGIYLAGKFGVRIENIVAATDDGHESLNAEPSPTLIELF